MAGKTRELRVTYEDGRTVTADVEVAEYVPAGSVNAIRWPSVLTVTRTLGTGPETVKVPLDGAVRISLNEKKEGS